MWAWTGVHFVFGGSWTHAPYLYRLRSEILHDFMSSFCPIILILSSLGEPTGTQNQPLDHPFQPQNRLLRHPPDVLEPLGVALAAQRRPKCSPKGSRDKSADPSGHRRVEQFFQSYNPTILQVYSLQVISIQFTSNKYTGNARESAPARSTVRGLELPA